MKVLKLNVSLNIKPWATKNKDIFNELVILKW